MPPSRSDPLAFAIYADEILACVSETLAVTGAPPTGAPPPPACQTVTSGLPPWDNCCDGQLTVDLRRVWTADRFPNQAVAAFKCGTFTLVLEYVVTHLRCANMECVCCPEEAAIADEVLYVRYAILRGLTCCMAEWASLPQATQAAIVEQVGLGPEGGCVGSQTTVYVALPCPCGPCP